MYTLTYIYTSLNLMILDFIPNLSIRVKFLLLKLKVNECKTLRSIYSISLVFHKACFEWQNSQ